jgi:hypothetical protein
MDSFRASSLILKGNRQIKFSRTTDQGATYTTEYLLPYPQLLGIEEEEVTEDIPGGDTIAATIRSTKSALITVRWPRLRMDMVADFMGADYSLTGSTPNRIQTLTRTIENVPGQFKIEGRVAYLGSEFPNGDYIIKAYLCQMVGSPSVSYETDTVAIYEAQFKAIEDVNGNWYQLIARETGVALNEALDTDAPSISGVSPADNATGVALTAGAVTVTFAKAIRFNAADFTLQHIVSATSVTEVGGTPTINSAQTVVSIPYTSLTADANYNVRVSASVRSLAADVLIAGASNTQFTAASS